MGKRSNADLILLQETHSTSDVETQWRHEWGGNIYFSHGMHNSRGVAIVCKNCNNIDVKEVHKDNNCRILLLNFEKMSQNLI